MASSKCIARWLPSPNAYPRDSAMAANSRLIFSARATPPVMAAMTSGARSFLPSIDVERFDVVGAQLGERLMHQSHAFEQRGGAAKTDIPVDR